MEPSNSSRMSKAEALRKPLIGTEDVDEQQRKEALAEEIDADE
jgi:hypothetical protein